VQRLGAKATKKLGAGGGTYLAGLLYVFVYLLVKLFVVVVWKKCTGKLQMKRIGFSDKGSDRIKEWAETNIVHLTIVCRA